jgi:hypothetical protein
MKGGILKMLGKAAGERVAGSGPGPVRALAASVVVGAVAGVLTYKGLRSNESDEE